MFIFMNKSRPQSVSLRVLEPVDTGSVMTSCKPGFGETRTPSVLLLPVVTGLVTG